MTGFLLWAAGGCLMAGLGISAFRAKKEVGFWANVKPLSMKDVKGYNRAVGKLFIVFGIVFIALGLPLLTEYKELGAIFSMLGVMIESITAMIVYTVVIQPKYEKK